MRIALWAGASLAVAALAAAGGAWATVAVFGNSQAENCYKAAKAGRMDDGAIRLCDKALAEDDLLPVDRGGTLVNRGVMRMRRGDLILARDDLNAGVALNPAVGDGWLDHGAVLVALKHFDEGKADIDKAIGLGVTEPEKAYYNRAIAEEGLNDEKAAYYDYQPAHSSFRHPGKARSGLSGTQGDWARRQDSRLKYAFQSPGSRLYAPLRPG